MRGDDVAVCQGTAAFFLQGEEGRSYPNPRVLHPTSPPSCPCILILLLATHSSLLELVLPITGNTKGKAVLEVSAML